MGLGHVSLKKLIIALLITTFFTQPRAYCALCLIVPLSGILSAAMTQWEIFE